jgi:hypothetical protein
MFLYNVTITIDLNVHEDWVRWMRETHIPEVMATGMFVSSRMSRLIGHEHADSEIYSIQYLVEDIAAPAPLHGRVRTGIATPAPGALRREICRIPHGDGGGRRTRAGVNPEFLPTVQFSGTRTFAA